MSSKTIYISEEAKGQKFLISVEDYHRMGEAGIFDNKPKVELIDGEIYIMSPFTSLHNSQVDKIAEFLTILFHKRAKVRTQGSIRLDQYSEPEPDISLLHFREDYYKEKAVGPKDIYLLIEVAITTKETDRTIKYQKYAQAGIPEYWIVLPEEGIIEVHSQPKGDAYLEKRTYQKKDEWIFQAFQLPIKGQDLLI